MIVDKTEIEEGKSNIVLEGGGGIDVITVKATAPTYDPYNPSTTTQSYANITFEGGGGFSYGVNRIVAIGGEIPVGLTFVTVENAQGFGFTSAPRGYIKLTIGSEKVRLSWKPGIAYGVAVPSVSYTSSQFIMTPYVFSAFMLGFGSPEKFTLAIQVPPLMFWGAYHLNEKLSLWGGIFGYSYGESYAGVGVSVIYIAVRGGIGYWFGSSTNEVLRFIRE